MGTRANDYFHVVPIYKEEIERVSSKYIKGVEKGESGVEGDVLRTTLI